MSAAGDYAVVADGLQITGKIGTFGPAVRRSAAGRGICWHGLGPLIPLEGRVASNQYRAVACDHLYALMQHVYLEGSSLFQNGSTPLHRAPRVSAWFHPGFSRLGVGIWVGCMTSDVSTVGALTGMTMSLRCLLFVTI